MNCTTSAQRRHGSQKVDLTRPFDHPDPHRCRIVELLRQRPLPVGETAQHLYLNQPQTSRPLRVLRDAGLIHVQAQGNRSGWHLRSQAFSDLHAWLAPSRRLGKSALISLTATCSFSLRPHRTQTKKESHGQRPT
ncbi:ArsR family transcriptional regulator [Deinococcus taeanensis]|uniref:ArsR/SmtB family transcription factor n=1 Tax=Deinococcus taeanensis TaxID=2737050 RepID=UPI001CDD7301|nr:ArsR family transcriptional regulator [Deinococcus taeanensis]